MEVVIDENSYAMVVEIGETLQRLTSSPQLLQELHLDEEVLLQLLTSQFLVIRQAGFWLLDYLYQHLALSPPLFSTLLSCPELE